MFVLLYQRIPFGVNIVFGPLVSYLAILMNIVVCWTLTSKKLMSTSTVLMQGLALADGRTAFFLYGIEPIFSPFYRYVTSKVVDLPPPYCIIHYWTTPMADSFHLTSVLLTTCLGLQKMIAIAFPIWTRSNMSPKRSAIVCCVCFLFSLSIHLPRALLVQFGEAQNDICKVLKPTTELESYALTTYPLIYTVLLALAVAAMLTSTIYITYKLCKRKQLRGKNTFSKYERNSCILILCVLVVFVVSECPRLYINGTVSNAYWGRTDKTSYIRKTVRTDIERDAHDCLERMTTRITMDIVTGCTSRSGSKKDEELKKERVAELLENILAFSSTHKHTTPFDPNVYMTRKISIKQRYDNILNSTLINPSFYKGTSQELMTEIVVSTYCSMIGNADDRIELAAFNKSCTKESELNMGLSIFKFMRYDIDKVFASRARNSVVYGYSELINQVISNLTDNMTIKTLTEDDVASVWTLCMDSTIIHFSDYTDCSIGLYNSLLDHLLLLILASSPYTEQMNYMINTVIDYKDADLKDLKLFIEIIKLFTVIACASNFIIYIAMSAKLRNEMRLMILPCVYCKQYKCISENSSEKEQREQHSTVHSTVHDSTL
ncbi:uncharacterized protein [Mytilus edulis]|uniref:uncharacterized protein n=1 Tax=Mytilus edulis TaxID=6550 RepID=UPI0039F10689